MSVLGIHPPRPRRSFTLIELLITISVVTILAATIVVAMAGAIEQARVERARAQVLKINELLIRRWEEYRTRPVRIRIPQGISGRHAAWLRLNALRELMRMEMPDRISDVADPPVSLPAVPSLNLAYQRRASAGWNTTHESAECLYLILALMREGDGTALDNFKPSEIADVDGDGMKEIIDPWGVPIYFLRWAPQLQTPLQDPNNRANAPDPFDPFRVGISDINSDQPNWAMYPFVFSAGPDETHGYDVATGFQYSTTGSTPPTLTPTFIPMSWPNNPYMPGNTAGALLPGGAWRDDIHSHLLE
ncbi:MAG: type II secretion system protein [Pirellulaceae bacterium]